MTHCLRRLLRSPSDEEPLKDKKCLDKNIEVDQRMLFDFAQTTAGARIIFCVSSDELQKQWSNSVACLERFKTVASDWSAGNIFRSLSGVAAQTRLTMEQEALRATAIQGALFCGLPDEVAALLLSAAAIRQSSKGAVLFHQGDAPDQLLQVVSGLVRMTQISAEGTQTTLRIMRSGDLLGCVAVLQQFPYPATATAVEDTIVLSWRTVQFLGLIKQHQAIMDNTLRIVGARTKDMVQRISDMSGKSVERRIAAALLRLATQAGTTSEDGIHIQFPITRDDLAEMAGLTYFTVSRTLSLWQKQGLVSGGRQRMTILDAHRLAEIADGRRQGS